MKNNRILVFALAVVLTIIPLSGYAADELFDTKEASKYVDKGISLLHAKNYNAAIAAFEESVAISPEAEAYYYLGYAYYLKSRKGDSESRELSRENFEKAYELDPNFTPTRTPPAEPMFGSAQPKQEQAGTPEPAANTPAAEQPKP